MTRGSYVPNLVKIGPQMTSQSCPQMPDAGHDNVILYSIQCPMDRQQWGSSKLHKKNGSRIKCRKQFFNQLKGLWMHGTDYHIMWVHVHCSVNAFKDRLDKWMMKHGHEHQKSKSTLCLSSLQKL